jgi:hypothetical protein
VTFRVQRRALARNRFSYSRKNAYAPKLESLFDLVGVRRVRGVRRVECGVEALGVRDVQQRVRGVVNELVLREPFARYDGAADRGRDPRKQVLDHAQRGKARQHVVQRAQAREEGIERTDLGPERASLDLAGRDAEP